MGSGSVCRLGLPTSSAGDRSWGLSRPAAWAGRGLCPWGTTAETAVANHFLGHRGGIYVLKALFKKQ